MVNQCISNSHVTKVINNKMSNSFATTSWRKCFLASLSTKNHLLEVVTSYPNIEIEIIGVGKPSSVNIIEYGLT